MWRLTAGELHYVRTIENCTLSRPRNVVLVFPNNAIKYVDVEVMAAGACVCQQTGNRDVAEYCTVYQFQFGILLNIYVVLNHKLKRDNIDKKIFNLYYQISLKFCLLN